MSGEASDPASGTRDDAVRQLKDFVCLFVSFAKAIKQIYC